jgi:predicted glycosyltransferase
MPKPYPLMSGKVIWIDLDNTPHVPFFIPIIRELETRGHRVVLTARDAFQVCELASRYGLEYSRIGHHYGKHVILKLFGLVWRSLQLAPTALREKPDLALSHGARSQVLLGNLLRIPTVVIMDYEHAKIAPLSVPKWKIAPDVVPSDHLAGHRVLTYSGIKEDVYAPTFTPDPAIKGELGLSEEDVIVTVRPPATEAHYHTSESDDLFREFMNWGVGRTGIRIVLLPRNEKQGKQLRCCHPSWFGNGRVVIPMHAVDGLNLLWHSDLVVSGGGTMNREAAALGVPVYSIFRGPMAAVDKHLEGQGLLTLITCAEDLPSKIVFSRRDKSAAWHPAPRKALQQIIAHVEAILANESRHPSL